MAAKRVGVPSMDPDGQQSAMAFWSKSTSTTHCCQHLLSAKGTAQMLSSSSDRCPSGTPPLKRQVALHMLSSCTSRSRSSESVLGRPSTWVHAPLPCQSICLRVRVRVRVQGEGERHERVSMSMEEAFV